MEQSVVVVGAYAVGQRDEYRAADIVRLDRAELIVGESNVHALRRENDVGQSVLQCYVVVVGTEVGNRQQTCHKGCIHNGQMERH